MAELFVFPDLPRDRDAIPLYRTPLPKEPDQGARELATRFGVRGKVRDSGSRLVVSGRGGSLELFRASDSLRWSTLHTLRGESSGPGDLPDEKTAPKLAEKFLRLRRIPLTHARLHDVTRTELAQVLSRKKEPETRSITAHVNYRYTLGGLPVFGPGAKIQVTFGAREKVVEFYRFWRVPKRDGERPLLPSETVMALLRRDPAFADLEPGRDRVAFRRARLGYFALPPREFQGMLIPVFAFDGTASTRVLERYDFVRYVVAVQFSADEAKQLGATFQELGHLFS